MLVFRSLALGLLGACCLLFASHPLVELYVVRERPVIAAAAPPPPAATIIDVASGVDPASVAGLVHLEADEHVVAVNDVPVSNDLDAGAAIASRRMLIGGRYVDLEVAGGAGSRRVLVLLH
jgi:S1-C subfamily serine protease